LFIYIKNNILSDVTKFFSLPELLHYVMQDCGAVMQADNVI
jgi:hypothetical protein